jgi:hypothetical protein
MLVNEVEMPMRVRPLSPSPQVIAVRFKGEQQQRRVRDLARELSLAFEGRGYGHLIIPEEGARIVDIFVKAVPPTSLQRAIALVEATIEKHGLGIHALVSTHTDFGSR